MTRSGLDALFAGFILHRDVPPPEARPAPFQRARVLDRVAALRELAAASSGDGKGSRWMAGAVPRLRRIEGLTEPVELYRQSGSWFASPLATATCRRARDFPDDKAGWEAWKAWRGDKDGTLGLREEIVRPAPPLAGDPARPRLPGGRRPLREGEGPPPGGGPGRPPAHAPRPPAARTWRCAPSCRASSTTSSWTSSRTPIRSRPRSSSSSARTAPARRAGRTCRSRPGGSPSSAIPKQSIYRFRRADISVYESVRAIVAKGKHVLVPLTANFRSEPALIAHLNDRFDEILGKPAAGKPAFDAAAGRS